MGIIKDIPEIFHAAVAKSHEGDTSVQDIDGMYYAAGWEVNSDITVIQHGGDNPNYKTNVLMFPEDQVAVCLLSNGANTNGDLANEIKGILDGNLRQSYIMSPFQILDISLSAATIIFCLLAVIFFIFGLRRKKMNRQQPLPKKRIIIIGIWMLITVAMCIILGAFPTLLGFDWSYVLVWLTYSILTVWVSLVLLTASITWFVYARRYTAGFGEK